MVTPNRPLMENLYFTKITKYFSNPLWGKLFLSMAEISSIIFNLLRVIMLTTGNSHMPVLTFPYSRITNLNFKNRFEL